MLLKMNNPELWVDKINFLMYDLEIFVKKIRNVSNKKEFQKK